MKSYIQFINEMADIIKKGSKLSVNNILLKNLKLEEINENIIYWRNDKNTFVFREGTTMVWFIKDNITLEKLKEDGSLLLFFPHKFMNNSPISDIWLRNKPIQKGIIGVLEAYTHETIIFIDMMSVRKGYMKNGINQLMIKTLIEEFPNAIIKFSEPTKVGKEFIKKYYPNARIEGEVVDSDIDILLNQLKNDLPNHIFTNKDIGVISRKVLPNPPSKNDYPKDSKYYEVLWDMLMDFAKNN